MYKWFYLISKNRKQSISTHSNERPVAPKFTALMKTNQCNFIGEQPHQASSWKTEQKNTERKQRVPADPRWCSALPLRGVSPRYRS
jgi:formate-dependent nitrite reductase cytochrome c552 subunit